MRVALLLVAALTHTAEAAGGTCGWTLNEMEGICNVPGGGVCTSNFINTGGDDAPVTDATLSGYRLNYVKELVTLHDQADEIMRMGVEASAVRDYRITSRRLAGFPAAPWRPNEPCDPALEPMMRSDFTFLRRMVLPSWSLQAASPGAKSIPHINFKLKETCGTPQVGSDCTVEVMPETTYPDLPGVYTGRSDWTGASKLDSLSYGVDEVSIRDTQGFLNLANNIRQTLTYQVFMRSTAFTRLNLGSPRSRPGVCVQGGCAARDIPVAAFKMSVATVIEGYRIRLMKDSNVAALRISFHVKPENVNLTSGDTITTYMADGTNSFGGVLMTIPTSSPSHPDHLPAARRRMAPAEVSSGDAGSGDAGDAGSGAPVVNTNSDSIRVDFSQTYVYGEAEYAGSAVNLNDPTSGQATLVASEYLPGYPEYGINVYVYLPLTEALAAYCETKSECMIMYDPEIEVRDSASANHDSDYVIPEAPGVGCDRSCWGGIVGGCFVPLLVLSLWMCGAFKKTEAPKAPPTMQMTSIAKPA